MMNRDNISTLVMAVTFVLSVIVSFTIYFSDLSPNQAWSVIQQQKDKGLVAGGECAFTGISIREKQ